MRIDWNLTSDEEWQVLESLGHKGTLGDKQFAFLSLLGFTGTLDDMLHAYTPVYGDNVLSDGFLFLEDDTPLLLEENGYLSLEA